MGVATDVVEVDAILVELGHAAVPEADDEVGVGDGDGAELGPFMGLRSKLNGKERRETPRNTASRHDA